MVFERYRKGTTWIGSLEPNIISITKTMITFGNLAIKEFNGNSFIEIYLDREKNKVGFKSTSNNITGFKLSDKNKSGRMGCTGKFLDLLPNGQFKAKVEEGFVVIEVPEIVDDTKTIKVNKNE